MSFATKCDRCGEIARTSAPFFDAPDGWLLLVQQHRHGHVPSDSSGYHLCIECTVSFDDWLEND